MVTRSRRVARDRVALAAVPTESIWYRRRDATVTRYS